MLAGDRARRQARSRREEHEAEVRFWRNYAALSRFARPQHLPPMRRWRSRVFIPAQRAAPAGVPAIPRQRRTP